MNIRSCIFWLLDGLRGGKIRKNLKQVKKDMQIIQQPKSSKLSSILQYAIENIPYYKDIDEPVISKFPIMNKKKYLDNYNQFFSLDYDIDDLYSYTTSGSSGTPFTGYQDKEKRYKHTADLLFFHKKCGWSLGEKYIFLRAWVNKYGLSKLHNIKNNVIPFDVLYLDEKMLEDIVYCMKHKRVKMILGYGSALNQLANYLESNNIFVSGIKTVISDSDSLKKESRLILEKRLGCNVVDRYSNEEHGLLGFSYQVDEPFEVNTSSYYIEILKLDKDEVAEPGEVGRIVITDLYNKAMPLIRYEIGDLGVSDEYSQNGIITIRNLQGRTSDMLMKKNGTRISSAVVNNYMEEMNGIEKYQLIQIGLGSFELYVVERNRSYSDLEYKKTLAPCIERDSELVVYRVERIESEASGKFKTFVSKCNVN